MRIIGIDPGVNGAIGVIGETESYVDVFDVPTVLANKSSNRQMVNVPELAKRLRAHVLDAGGQIVAIIENVQPMPSVGENRRGMGAASAFAFGKSAGLIIGCVQTLGVSLHIVSAARWKGYLNLGREKDQSRELAQRLWPDAPIGLKRHHNRAEALLLAKYYRDAILRPGNAAATRTAVYEHAGQAF